MKYREFINSMSNEDFAEAIVEDAILHMACANTLQGPDNAICPHGYEKCRECITKLLDEEMEVEISKDL